MLRRQRSGSVVCPGCGRLVGVGEEACWNCGRRNPSLWGFAPALRRLGDDLGFANLVVTACAVFYLATLAVDVEGIGMEGVFTFLQPSTRALLRFGASGVLPVVVFDRWWTVLSAGWLHGGLLHLLFNLLWLRQLAPAIAQVYGPSRMVILYVGSSASGFVLSSVGGAYLRFPVIFTGAPVTIGASAGIFGLLAALIVWSRRGGAAHVGQQAWTWAVFMGVFGLIPNSGIDNYAHVGGFLGGFALGYALDPRRSEKAAHLAAALALLVGSLAAVIASLVVAVPMAF